MRLGQQLLEQGPAGQEPGQGQQKLTAALGAVLRKLCQRLPGVAVGAQRRLHQADLGLWGWGTACSGGRPLGETPHDPQTAARLGGNNRDSRDEGTRANGDWAYDVGGALPEQVEWAEPAPAGASCQGGGANRAGALQEADPATGSEWTEPAPAGTWLAAGAWLTGTAGLTGGGACVSRWTAW